MLDKNNEEEEEHQPLFKNLDNNSDHIGNLNKNLNKSFCCGHFNRYNHHHHSSLWWWWWRRWKNLFNIRSMPAIPMRRLIIKTIRFLFLVILMVTVIINILFIIETRNRLQQQQQQQSLPNIDDGHFINSLYDNHSNDFNNNNNNNQQIIKLDIISSQNRAMVTVDGTIILDDSEDGKNRGIHILVLNQMTGSIMARRHFDTYSTHEDEAMSLFISMVSDGRILIFAIKDEGSFQLKKTARDFLTRLGSKRAQDIGWRDMWTMVIQKRLLTRQHSNTDPLLGESYSKCIDFNSWAQPAILHVDLELYPSEINDDCKWTTTTPSTLFNKLLRNFLPSSISTESNMIDEVKSISSNFVFLTDDNETKERRKHFCSRIEGYGSVCSCNDPLPLRFVSNYDPMAKISQVPIAIIASNRPHYLYRMLRTLLLTPGCNPSMITIFIDGYYEEPLEVAKLFGLRGIQHTPIGRGNSRITQHYKASLTATFNLYPDAQYAIILEEDLDVSPDFFGYFAQTMHLLDQDDTLFCISAWNDQAYEHTSSDTSLLYRVETMPGLGWMLTRKLYKNELESKWPTPDKSWDWDMWMRLSDIRRGRECIVPDVSRTYHFGSSGLNMNSYFQDMYFKKHAFNTNPSVLLKNVDLLKRENYERLINRLIRMAVIIDHRKGPCDSNFLKTTTTTTINVAKNLTQNQSSSPTLQSMMMDTTNIYLIFIRMTNVNDYNTWLQMAKCLHIWDLDARGYHNGMWRLHYYHSHLIIIGVPYSPYSVFKPPHIVPLSLLSKSSSSSSLSPIRTK
uniref:Protein O-linked-mannose beta-1,2-N-acetylglucosaminyltransferase 1 n=1 Tax=Dermatophagoides pteronyssinus TaxID=6956 RepID=A0A6P6XYU5_DERPT|nr:protein O-linked-mannose beta-1,2-N-acetylglucosaminyltransferase 1-like [Dermatophagoides pteronyssinus]